VTATAIPAYGSVAFEGAVLDCKRTFIDINRAARTQAAAPATITTIACFYVEAFDVNVDERQAARA
jgi:hypothetical protein